MRRTLTLMPACSVVAILLVSPAWAQAAPTASEATGDAATGSNDIVVTAQKREERLQTAPVSVSAIGRAELQERGATDIKDVLGSIPGLAFNQNDPSQTKYNIRGLATTSSSPTVGLYLDDVSIVTQGNDFSGAFDIVFFDIDRLEVLKGPQGTLYGGSAMGGAIKYVSVKPSLDTPSLDMAVGGATTAHGSGSYNVQAVANVPIVPGTFAVRVGGYRQHEGGYIDNVADLPVSNPSISTTPEPTLTPQLRSSLSTLNEKDINYIDIYALRLSALWEPTDSWSIRPQVLYQVTRLNSDSDIFTNQSGLTSSYRLLSPKTDEGTVSSLQVDKRIGAVNLTSLSAYFDRNLRFTRDYSFEIARLTGGATLTSPYYADNSLSSNPDHVKTFSQELRISSAGTGRQLLTWIGGLFYSDQKEDVGQTVTTPNPAFANNISYVSDSRNDLKQYAAFGEVTLHLTSKLGITGGVRVFKITQNTNQFSNGVLAGGFSQRTGSGTDHGVNPKAGISYQATRDNLLYANAAKGFRPGGLNFGTLPDTSVCRSDLGTVGLTAEPAQFKSDSVWTYEAGSKNEFDGGKIMLNAAGFYSKWDNIQQRVFLSNCGFGFTDNFGTAEIKGAELEASIRPLRWLKIGGTMTYTDTEITQPAVGTTAQKGDSIQFVPKWMASAYASFTQPVGGGWDAVFRADYQYRSKQRYSYDRTRSVLFPDGSTSLVPNEAQFEEGSSTVDLVASVENGVTNVRLYVDNLTDAEPLSRVIRVFPERAQTIRPRTIGIEIRQKFR